MAKKSKTKNDSLETIKSTLVVWWIALVCLMGICFISVLHIQNEIENKEEIKEITTLKAEEKKNYGSDRYPVYVTINKAKALGYNYNYYVLDPDTTIGENKTYSKKERIADDGIIAIIKHGQYLPSSLKEEDKKAIIQLSLWIYKGYLTENESNAVLNNPLSSYIRFLLDKAKNEVYDQSSVVLSTDTPSIQLSNDKNYYMSELIELKFSNKVTVVDYSLDLNNAPKGTRVVDENGKVIDDITKVTKFYLKIPEENVNSENKNFTISINVTTSDYYVYGFRSQENKSEEADIIIDNLEVAFNNTKNEMGLNIPKDTKITLLSDKTIMGFFILCVTSTICASIILGISVYQNSQESKPKKKRSRKKK